jgi:hypothetical protein
MKKKSIENTSDYYLTKAEIDKKAGEILAEKRLYSQAIYFSSQAMEKFIKAEICKKINIANKYTHDLVNKHSIKDLMIFLINISVPDKPITNKLFKEQLSNQVKEILGEINYDTLHNNLRYPYYNSKSKEFVTFIYEEKDYKKINETFKKLKIYISQLYKIN